MTRFNRAWAVLALMVTGLIVSACSVSISSGSPTPTPSARPSPTPTPKEVSVLITSQIDTGVCETSAHVTVFVDGRNVGTMSVDSQSVHTDRLTVMMAPAERKYSLKGAAFFQVNGQSFSLNVSGTGRVDVNSPGPNTWNLTVDNSRLANAACPSGGGTWPLVVQT